MKPYKHLKGYLERFTLFRYGRLHFRIHHILSADQTPFLHTHPFHYISIILSGGYTEYFDGKTHEHTVGSVIVRKNTDPHRILSVQNGTKTLFLTWVTPEYHWEFKGRYGASDGWIDLPRGIYKRTLYGVDKFSKFDVYWHKSSDSVSGAASETNPSIDQQTKGTFISCIEN